MARRLVAADEDQQGLLQDVVVGQPFTVDLRVHKDADQVLGRLGSTLFDLAARVVVVRHKGIHRDLHVSLGHSGTESDHHFVGPLQEHLSLVREHTKHVADDRHGQRRGDVSDEITFTALAYRVDENVAQRADGLILDLQTLSCEAGVDELAAQQMCRIIHVDHHWQGILIGADAACVREQLGIALGVNHGLVRRRRGQTVAVTEHRLVGPHPSVGFAGGGTVGIEIAVGQIHIGLRHGHEISWASPNDISTLAAELEISARFGKPSEASSFA